MTDGYVANPCGLQQGKVKRHVLRVLWSQSDPVGRHTAGPAPMKRQSFVSPDIGVCGIGTGVDTDLALGAMRPQRAQTPANAAITGHKPRRHPVKRHLNRAAMAGSFEHSFVLS